MVLRLLVLALALALAATGCKQSLFEDKSDDTTGDDAPGSDGGPGSDGSVASACTAPCIGDAGGDFDGSATGKNMRWRYLDDNRNRSWAAMTAGTPSTGSGMNKIARCDGTSGGSACSSLPDALLVTSTGSGGAADPAVELTVPSNVVMKLSLRVSVPDGASSQTIRLYRSAREDTLFTGNALPGQLLETSLTFDALKGDRILMSVAPTGDGADGVAVQMFASGTATVFPAQCHLAVDFETASVTGNTLANRCGPDALTFTNNATAIAVPPALAAGPFPESGMAGDFVKDRYYDTVGTFDRSNDNTVQLWAKRDAIVDDTAAWILSDMDLDDDDGGGIAIAIDTLDQVLVTSCDHYAPTPVFIENTAPYPNPAQWHFIRVVEKGDTVSVCVDGAKKFDLAIPKGTAQSDYVPRIGRNSRWTPAGSYVDGQLDDVRMLKGVALPCE